MGGTLFISFFLFFPCFLIPFILFIAIIYIINSIRTDIIYIIINLKGQIRGGRGG